MDVQVTPATPALRVRHVVKDERHYYLLFNEERAPLNFTPKMSSERPWQLFDASMGSAVIYNAGEAIHLAGYELKVLVGFGTSLSGQSGLDI